MIRRQGTVARSRDQRLRLIAGAALLLLTPFAALPVKAQDSGIFGRGDAVVTGFSGTRQPDPSPAGDPLDETFIDLDGASAQIFKLEPGAPSSAQLISAPPALEVKARDIGQVFAIGLDGRPGPDAAGTSPNIYLGATSAFGLQIVVPDADGRPERVKKGHPNAEWMAGQFGLDKGGEPGSIFKIDGKTGAVSLFATIPGNSGPGLGDIVFDSATLQFFVSDLDTGLIHRVDLTGNLIDAFDHGQTGRTASGLPAVADDGRTADIKSPAFDALDPATWGFTQPERRVWGLGLRAGRLYYAVAEGPEIWSVSINLDGTFGADPRREIEVSGTPNNHPISDIAFDNADYMYIAQRGGIKGSYDYSVFADAKQSVVFRFKREIPDDSATPGMWIPIPDEYAIGFPPDYRNTSGGLALGYGYDQAGAIRRGACDAMIWSTGDSLRDSPEYAAQLAGGGSAIVNGLQGTERALTRPDNEPPFKSYFVDYDGKFEDPEKQGHAGDVEIWQPCDPQADFGTYAPAPYLPPGYTPPTYLPPGETPPVGLPEWNFNLRLDKEAVPGTCVIGGLGVLCDYVVRLTNTGPDAYVGPIVINDELLAAPAGAVMTFADVPPWLCIEISPTEHQCTFGPAALLPGDSVDLFVTVDLPVAAPVCHLDNFAHIVWPLGLGDAIAADDFDLATATIPAAHCPPPVGEKTNLKIEKAPWKPVCTDKFAHFECDYAVVVRNAGPGIYNGTIKVDETVPIGTTAIFVAGPSWTCTAAAPYSCEHDPVVLAPNQTRSFGVRVKMPKNLAGPLACQATNKVKIVEAAADTDQNTDPTDDEAEATMILPGNVAECPGVPKLSNLKLKKTGPAEKCTVSSGNWECEFKVRVQNFGAAYTSAIQFVDALPFGTPAGATVTFQPPPGWNCGGPVLFPNLYQCSSDNPNLPHLGAVEIPVIVKIPVAPTLKCEFTNNAQIVKAPGGTLINSFAGDDFDSATAELTPILPQDGQGICLSPAMGEPEPPLVTPERTETNLTITKTAGPSETTATGQNTPFTITVTNEGPGVFNGPIEVLDTLFDGATVEPSNGSWSAPWTCEGQSLAGHPEQGICTHPPVELDPGESVTLDLEIEAPNSYVAPSGSQVKCSYKNKVEILDPPGGSPQNTNAGDDVDFAEARFEPFEKHGTIFCELGLTTPPPSCPQGWSQTPIPGKCCPPRTKWDGQRCQRGAPPPREKCPPNSDGAYKYPDCRCEPGYSGTPPNCKRVVVPPKECPKGFVGTPPNCERVVVPPKECPKGFVGTPPNCERVVVPPKECPKGFVGTPPNCERVVVPPKECPKGFVGTPPNCRRVVVPPKECPQGTRGKYPECKPIDCPKGTRGQYPDCKPITCPKGTTGRYPNCKPIVPDCKKGERLVDGKCVRVPVSCGPESLLNRRTGRCEPLAPPATRTCPEGFTGTPPNCKRM